MGALSNLTVIEYSQFASGPYCGKLFADLGATVIKIEEPGLGDKARNWGPFPQDLPHPEKSGMYLYLNTNKQSVTLNLETATGIHILKELLINADIFVEDKPPKEMMRLGLSYEALQKLNAALIVTSITPFGQSGPYRDYRGSDLVNFTISGMASHNPAEGVDDIETKPPLKAPIHVPDLMPGLTAAICSLSAVMSRKTSGLGQHVDVSQQEALASLGRTELAAFSYKGTRPTRKKGKKRSGAMMYPCKDGYIVMSGTEGGFWPGLVDMLGNPDWVKAEWQDSGARSEDIEAIHEKIAQWTIERTTEEINREAIPRRIPCSPVRTVKDLMKDEQYASRDFFVNIDHPEAGNLTYLGAPYKLAGTPWAIRQPAPLLGEHNESVICGMLGYSRQDLVKMRQAGII